MLSDTNDRVPLQPELTLSFQIVLQLFIAKNLCNASLHLNRAISAQALFLVV